MPWFPAHYAPGLIGGSGPWYTTSFTPGDGLRIVPTGNGGATYDTVRAIWFPSAPGDARINRVRFTGVRGRVEERQLLGLRQFDQWVGAGASASTAGWGRTGC